MSQRRENVIRKIGCSLILRAESGGPPRFAEGDPGGEFMGVVLRFAVNDFSVVFSTVSPSPFTPNTDLNKRGGSPDQSFC